MTDATDTRGQTLHDFAIGMAVFLLVLGYVFAFVPSLFTPFTPDSDSSPIRGDRTADFLTRDLLAENTSAPGLLNATCTEDFFNDSVAWCGFGSRDIQEIAALPSRTSVNVTIWRNGAIQKYNNTRLARGPSPNPGATRVIRAARIVSLNGQDYRFVVRIW